MAASATGRRGRRKSGGRAEAAGAAATPAQEAIARTFDEIGGVPALAQWVKASEDNRKIFYANLYPKLIAVQVGGDPEQPVIHEIRRSLVRP